MEEVATLNREERLRYRARLFGDVPFLINLCAMLLTGIFGGLCLYVLGEMALASDDVHSLMFVAGILTYVLVNTCLALRALRRRNDVLEEALSRNGKRRDGYGSYLY